MANRFVRASLYRHVHGEEARKDKCYSGCRPFSSGDGDFVTANTKYLAYASVGGGGPIVVHPLSQIGRIAASPFHINVHKAKVLDLEFNPFIDRMVATASDDGLIKATLFPEGGLTGHINESNVTLTGHQKKVSLLHWNPTANNVLASTSYDHTIKVWDVEKQAEIAALADLPDVTQSFAWNANGSLIAATNKDKNLRVFDPRQPDAVQMGATLPGSKPAKVVWLDNHEKLLVIGFSKMSTRQYQMFDPKNLSAPLSTVDIDQASGVMIPHYDPDNSILYLGGKGDGNIRYFEVKDDQLHLLSQFSSNDSQKGLCFLPKQACNVKKCEIAVALRLMRDYIAPVHFLVPRKSELFQQDLYPETAAPIPAINADEWLEGKNGEPVKMSMEPGAASDVAQVEFVAQKSPAELKAELAAANARIAELEAELAKLKA